MTTGRILKPDKGLYANLSFRTNPSLPGKLLPVGSVYADAAPTFPLHPTKRRILALWGMFWGTFGDVPYLNLPGTSLEFLQRSVADIVLHAFAENKCSM